MRETDTIRRGDFRTVVVFKIKPGKPGDEDSTGYVETLTKETNLETWETRATTRGQHLYDRGLESREDRQDIAIGYSTLYTDYNAAALPVETDAAICDGVAFEIMGVGDITGRRKKLKITLRKVK